MRFGRRVDLGTPVTVNKVWVIYSGSNAIFKSESREDLVKLCNELNDKLEGTYIVEVESEQS